MPSLWPWLGHESTAISHRTHVGKKPSPALPASFPKSENRPLLSYCSKFTTCNDTFIEKLTEVQQTVEQLLAQLQASEHDKFAAHLYRSRRDYRSVCQRAGKSGKQIERYRRFRWPRAWDSKATFGSGSTCCGWRLKGWEMAPLPQRRFRA